MRRLILIVIFCLSPMMVEATLYSCRDSEGRLHVTDNLQSLPDECRADVREVEAGDPDNLHFVPETSPPPVEDTRSRFELEVLEQQRRQQEQEQREEQLIRQARSLVSRFEQAQQDRRNAIRRWSADSRRTIEQAATDMAAARNGKQQLLTTLGQQRVSIRTSEQVRALLEQIPEP
ncbi:DUF4124 domain-containing protein [Pelovirga terrestris]|uniref:DUF4124 domain-containing protein n=1 Tax=Pelovirga terrestris TaxID=2771352 RepID=A0A8J6QXV5_9BACT|nr:DUF4124 domain-containing protein [Pelovirga terrestris]MBD1400527.1 DUF4124 domain-containing protein [Pelovirga terrestris]